MIFPLSLLPRFRKSLIGGADRRGFTSTERSPQSINLGGKGVSFEQIYRESPAVRATVDFLSTNTAGTPLHGFRKEGDGSRRLPASDRLERLIRRPNPFTTGYAFRRDQVVDLCLSGHTVAVKVLDDGDLVAALVRVPPKSVALLKDSDVGPFRYEITFAGGGRRQYARDDLLIVSHFSPDGGLGLSPLTSLAAVLAEDRASTINREAFWLNSARQGGWIERPLDAPDWDDEIEERFLEDWKVATMGPANAGDTVILADGMKLHEGGFSPEQSQYVQSKELTLRAVCAVFGVPAELLSGTRNIDAFQRALVLNTLSPLFTLIEDAWDLDVVPGTVADPTQHVNGRIYTEHVVEQRSRGNFLWQAKQLEAATGGPWLTVDETRALVGKPPLPNGEGNRLHPPRQAPGETGNQ